MVGQSGVHCTGRPPVVDKDRRCLFAACPIAQTRSGGDMNAVYTVSPNVFSQSQCYLHFYQTMPQRQQWRDI